MYMHIFFAQIAVMPLFSHLHKAGFFVMRVICKLEDMYRFFIFLYIFLLVMEYIRGSGAPECIFHN